MSIKIHSADILGSREQWNSAQEDVLSGLSQEVMASYGEEYIHSMQQRLVDMYSVSSSDTGPFLKALKHAILSPKPKPYYYPGASAWALPLLYRHCPTSLSDRIFTQIFMNSNAQPAELMNSWSVPPFDDPSGAGIACFTCTYLIWLTVNNLGEQIPYHQWSFYTPAWKIHSHLTRFWFFYADFATESC